MSSLLVQRNYAPDDANPKTTRYTRLSKPNQKVIYDDENMNSYQGLSGRPQGTPLLVTLILVLFVALSGCSFDTKVERPIDGTEPDDGISRELDMRDPAYNEDGLFSIDVGTPVDMPSNTPDLGTDLGNPPQDLGIDSGNTSVDMGVDMNTNPIQMCGGQQVDTRTSNAHCGACDNACDSVYGACNNGTCECYSPYDACGSDNACTLKSADPQNCGSCGNTCGASEVCYSGTCGCFPGFKLCGGKCVDLDSDPQHCGDCNVDCGGDACGNGSCRANSRCGFDGFACTTNGGTACTQSEWNPQFCGASLLDPCGTACGPGQICGRSGIVFPFKCKDYRPAIGCTSCPCSDCNGEFCLEVDDPEDLVFCVDD